MEIRFTTFVRDDEKSKQLSALLIEQAIALGFIEDKVSPQFIFSIGGDGTFLRAVHQYVKISKNVVFIGIHTGSLGYFTDFKTGDLSDVFQSIIDNNITVKKYPLVKAKVRQNNVNSIFYAVNEVRIENVHHTLVLDVELNNEKLETYRGNGILVATQLGSSGYNKSIGGAIIKRDLHLLEYTKIAPISNSVYRPLVNPLIIGPKDVLKFKGKNDFTFFGYDNLISKLSDGPFEISVTYASKKIAIMHSSSRPYTKILYDTFLGGHPNV